MPDLYGDNQGSLVALSSDGFPAVVDLEGVTGEASVLVTSIGFGQSANVQFMHTLRDVIYVYAFGERLGSIKVGGILVFRSCRVGGSSPVGRLLSYYKQNTVSKNDTPISVSIGGEALKGFLIAVELGGFDQVMGTANFSFSFASLPAG